MKLKAVLHETCPQAVIEALQGSQFRQAVLERVLQAHLRVKSMGPAEFYVQHCDLACGDEPMCEVRLTGVSANTRRATEDFLTALKALETVYREVLEKHFTTEKPCQLFVSLMLDQKPFKLESSLLERDPVYVPELKRL